MKQIAKLLMYFLVSTMFMSCNENLMSDASLDGEFSETKISNTEIKKEFGVALAKVLAESSPARKLIRNEALKKIDHDYDVLYLLVKDEKLSSNTTLEELLLNYVDKELLESIERQIPNLTILVPQLPENTFSAELWDVDNEIPVVGIRIDETNDVPVFDSSGNESVIEAQYIPGYPIVVVKENERIASGNMLTKSLTGSNSSTFVVKSSPTLIFSFLDDTFDNLNPKDQDEMKVFTKASSSGSLVAPEQLQRLYDAYDIYANTDGWQRDYVYYGITPNKTKGPFNYQCMEHIVGFEMIGDALEVFNKISDQAADPKYDPNKSLGTGRNSAGKGGWTDGEFEFKIKMYLGKGNELVKYLRISPDKIFTLGRKASGNMTSAGMRYVLEGMKTEKVDVCLPLFEWNLEDCGSKVKFVIEEVDSQETIKKTTSMTTEFITSFETTTSSGEKEKVGTKYGNSIRNSSTVTYETTETKGSDELGEFYVNFGDDIIAGKDTIGNGSTRGHGSTRVEGTGGRTHPESSRGGGGNTSGTATTTVKPIYNIKYNTGWCRLYIAPLVVK